MKVVDRLAEREKDWNELQMLLSRIEGKRISRAAPPLQRTTPLPSSAGPGLPESFDEPNAKGISAAHILRLGELYRSACADLMLAEAHDLPRETVAYLHNLVGRAHNAVYRSKGFRLTDWGRVIFVEVPRRLRSDPMLRLSALTFYGLFLLCGFVGAAQPGFASRVVGQAQVEMMEAMYDRSFSEMERDDTARTGNYIMHNAGIGLSCYGWGLLFGLGSLAVLAFNAVTIGAIFGHMATTSQANHFFNFVTTHAPFELTAVVFAGAAGLILGSGLIVTKGQSRMASLQREARRSLPVAGVSVILFILAAFLEGYVSPSSLPYWSKATISIVCGSIVAFYMFGLGRSTGDRLMTPA